MNKNEIKTMSINEFAADLGVDPEVVKIKLKLVNKIKAHCKKNKVSQRSLAKLVTGLSQDRISRIFNDQVGGMTIDKLVQILSALKIKVNISLKSAA
jgi:predicted XRE-type DNA-binding protein